MKEDAAGLQRPDRANLRTTKLMGSDFDKVSSMQAIASVRASSLLDVKMRRTDRNRSGASDWMA